ncbi:transposase, IS605 OrfB family, central region [Actinopolyspora lacussalsi subsp. righensis]|uniref:Transposase, IS605 OrfB family, central region n=2 Tax=Actinopolyspora righensis TaxID=995060 RepID=A0A1I6YDD4_9ACTN|nr:transposase, IS605 OrfB family, central region [Actinopolyspora righensis]
MIGMDMTPQETDTASARYLFRLRVSNTAEKQLREEWGRCRWVWNECVAMSRKVYRDNKATGADDKCGPAWLDKLLTEARQANRWLREGATVPQQQTIRDFGKSRAKALKDIKARLPMKQRAGMPRIKRDKDTRPSLAYTKRGFRVKDGRLYLAGGIELTVVWSRDLPSEPSSVRVYQDNLGHWYASFVVQVAAEPLPGAGRAIGIDWGLTETATTTDGAYDLPHAQHGKRAQQRLAHYQRQMSRRERPRNKPQTKGYRKEQRQAAKAHKKVARQRQDTGRKWAKSVARHHDQIAVEDFKPKFLAKTTMARKAADAAIGATKTALVEQARKHGRDLRLVDPKYTTMDCAHCGARAKHRLPLSERTFTCTACGASSPRDKNSARVMPVRAGFTPADVEGVRPGHLLRDRAA